MRLPSALISAVLVGLLGLLAAPASYAAGIQALTVPADGALPALSGAVWTPCAAAPSETRIGPFSMLVTRDCPVLGTRLPLIVISHGRGGTFMAHRDTAQALADAGFVVAAISHPGDNAQDNGRSNELSSFVQRPADMKRLVDYLLGGWPSASAIDPDRIGFFGFSRGGYTGLVSVGAVPVFRPDIGMCAQAADESCVALRHGTLPSPAHDSRIKAAVVADPLGVFFSAASFQAVSVPVQVWRSEFGGDGVTPEGVAAIAAALPAKPDLMTVRGAGHFAFLPPCPESIRQAAPEICSDPPGFDRASFHAELNAKVVAFFRRHLR